MAVRQFFRPTWSFITLFILRRARNACIFTNPYSAGQRKRRVIIFASYGMQVCKYLILKARETILINLGLKRFLSYYILMVAYTHI